MKNLILVLLLAATPLVYQGCSTQPSARVVQVQTLKAVGTAAKTGMDAATQLLKQGSITVSQWQAVATFYNTRWQPAYGVAVASAQSDLSLASPDLANLLNQFLALVASYSTKTPSP